MDFFQWARNPWGQEVVVRISWWLLWAAVIGGVLFIALHLILRRRWIAKETEEVIETSALNDELPERVVRHPMASRFFHWLMAASMFVLLFTGFLPVVGVKFNWVTLHWIAGVVLIASILFHIVHATFWQNLMNVWISFADVKDWWRDLSQSLGRSGPAPDKPGKYPMDHKLYHHAVVLFSMGVIITGVYMMFRVQTPFWARNPYLLAESTWGWVYVIHGLSAVGLVTLVISHVYFSILPEKRWITLSMFVGWIARSKYLSHHDPKRWPVSGVAPAAEPTETSESS